MPNLLTSANFCTITEKLDWRILFSNLLIRFGLISIPITQRIQQYVDQAIGGSKGGARDAPPGRKSWIRHCKQMAFSKK